MALTRTVGAKARAIMSVAASRPALLERVGEEVRVHVPELLVEHVDDAVVARGIGLREEALGEQGRRAQVHRHRAVEHVGLHRAGRVVVEDRSGVDEAAERAARELRCLVDERAGGGCIGEVGG